MALSGGGAQAAGTTAAGAAVLGGCSALNCLVFASPKASQLGDTTDQQYHTRGRTGLLLPSSVVTSSVVVCHGLCGDVLEAEHGHPVVLRPRQDAKPSRKDFALTRQQSIGRARLFAIALRINLGSYTQKPTN